MARASIQSTFDPKNKIKNVDLIYEKAKKGDQESKDKLIEGMIFYAGSIAARWASRFPERGQDFLGVAILTLVECAGQIKDKEFLHFKKYVHVSITGALKNFIAKDNTVSVPLNSLWWAELKKKQPGLSLRRVSFLAARRLVQLGELDPAALAVRESNMSLLRDCLSHRVLSIDEKKIALGMLEGKTDIEIAKEMKISSARVGQIKHRAIPKLRKVILGEW